MSSVAKIKPVDASGDGILTAEEHTAASASMFEQMDTDKDGFLSKSEMAAGHAGMTSKTTKYELTLAHAGSHFCVCQDDASCALVFDEAVLDQP